MKNPTKPDKSAILSQFTLPAAAYRIRQLDPRNVVIERQNPRGGWLIAGYYGDTGSLCRALTTLSAQLPDSEARDLRQAVTDLTAALDANAARIVAALGSIESL